MARRMLQINELLRGELANLLTSEWERNDCLVTITHVKCSPNLLSATIFISVLPENMTGTALKALKKLNSTFSSILKKKLNIRRIPRFHWRLDFQEREAVKIEKVISQLPKNNS